MYYVNQARKFFGYGPADQTREGLQEPESSELVDVSEDVFEDVDISQHCHEYFKDVANSSEIENKLVKGNDEERKEFLEYCRWSINALEKRGNKFQARLAKFEGEFSDAYISMLNENKFNKVMSSTNKSSREFREWAANMRRAFKGIAGKGYQPEEGRDVISSFVHAYTYLAWGLIYFGRVASGLTSLPAQVAGVFPARHHNAPNPQNSTDASMYQVAERAAEVQMYLTMSVALPYMVHVLTQVREFCRGYEGLNTAEMAALNCYKSAVEYMTSREPTSIQSLLYKFGIESFKKSQSKSAKLDARRMLFSTIREIVFFPENLLFSALNSINLVSGQVAFPAPWGAIFQTLNGVFGLGQYAMDFAQGRTEARSAEEKLRQIVDSINSLSEVEPGSYVSILNNQEVTPLSRFYFQGVANNVTLVFQERQEGIQIWESRYGKIRCVKGVIGAVTASAALAYGIQQLVTGHKAPLEALGFSLAGTFVSGVYYIVAFIKMKARDDERMLKKELYRNAQFARLGFPAWMSVAFQASGRRGTFSDFEHLFQNGGKGNEVIRSMSFQDNEFIFLDVISALLLKDLHEASRTEFDAVEKVMKSELTLWLIETWKVSPVLMEATLRACCDKASVFQVDQLKREFANPLRIDLPLSNDKLEKRLKPSLLVLAKMRNFEVDEGDSRKSFFELVEEYTGTAKELLSEAEEKLLHGVQSKEEFIASVLHIYERATVPKRLDEDWIKFAKLVSLMQVMDRERKHELETVINAKREDLKLPKKMREAVTDAEFEEFKDAVKAYAKTSIFQRGKQVHWLKVLSRNPLMEKLHLLSEKQEWKEKVAGKGEKQTKDRLALIEGILLLVDRVDRYPLPLNIPSSPRSNPSPLKNTTVTRVPSMLDAEDPAEKGGAFGGQDIGAKKRKANDNYSDGRGDSTTSTQRTSTPSSTRSARNFDDHEDPDEVLVSFTYSDSEATEVYLHTPPSHVKEV